MRRAFCSSLLLVSLCCPMNPACAHAGDVVARLAFDHWPTFLAPNGSPASVTLRTRDDLVQETRDREATLCSHGLRKEATPWLD